MTNVVKHFKWEPRGKRRIHQAPNRAEVGACLPWLKAEVRAVRPRVVVFLGATAAKAVLGPRFKVTQERGRLLPSELGPPVLATVHPSSILRSEENREQAMEAFVGDLRAAATAFAGGREGGS